jgi:hypothetical protein
MARHRTVGEQPVKLQSLPTWCIEWRQSVDIVRKLIRRSPDLQSLGRKFGSTKLYDEGEAAKILAALEHRGSKEPADAAKGGQWPVMPAKNPARSRRQ